MNKKELMAALRAKSDEMKAENDPEKFKELNNEFLNLKAQLERIEAIEEAEKYLVEDAFEEKAAEEIPADAVKEFAAAARKGFVEGTPADGGYTVPEDIQTRINKYRDAKFSLRQLVSVEVVKTESGERTYQKRSNVAGFGSVSEGGKIPKMDHPKFERIPYKIEKYGGFMEATNELLDDTDANITATVVEWFADNARVTDNKLILATLDEKYTRATDPETAEALDTLDDVKKVINVKLGQAFAPTSVIVTNDDGLQWLDTLKDGDGKSLLKYSELDPLQPYIAVGFRKVPLHIIPNSDLPTDAAKGTPLYIGDLKEACRIYDRKKLSLMASSIAAIGGVSAFEQDMTFWRGLVRLDCETLDAASYYKGFHKETVG